MGRPCLEKQNRKATYKDGIIDPIVTEKVEAGVWSFLVVGGHDEREYVWKQDILTVSTPVSKYIMHCLLQRHSTSYTLFNVHI